MSHNTVDALCAITTLKKEPEKISFDIRPFHYFLKILRRQKKLSYYEMSLASEWTINERRIEFELLLLWQNKQILLFFYYSFPRF